MHTGSHYKNGLELGKFIAKQKLDDGTPKYNLTVMVWKENTDYGRLQGDEDHH